jgi:hypothetical protein
MIDSEPYSIIRHDKIHQSCTYLGQNRRAQEERCTFRVSPSSHPADALEVSGMKPLSSVI